MLHAAPASRQKGFTRLVDEPRCRIDKLWAWNCCKSTPADETWFCGGQRINGGRALVGNRALSMNSWTSWQPGWSWKGHLGTLCYGHTACSVWWPSVPWLHAQKRRPGTSIVLSCLWFLARTAPRSCKDSLVAPVGTLARIDGSG